MFRQKKHDSAVFFTWTNLGESLSCWTQDSEGEGGLQDGEKVFSRRCPLFLFSSSFLCTAPIKAGKKEGGRKN